MINKYPGSCAGCGARVESGAGTAERREGRWTVVCSACGDAQSGGSAGAAIGAAAEGTSAPAALLERPADYTLLSGHAASPYQAAVMDHFRYGRGSRIVKAVAGSGKTTTMKNAVRWLPPWMSVQMLAFNVEAAEQLKGAIEELAEADRETRHYNHVRAGTFHSLGMGALRRALPDAQIRVEDGKTRKLMAANMGGTPEGDENVRLYSAFVGKLVGLAKGEGIGALVPDTDERWWDIIDHHGLYLDSREATPEAAVDIARRVMRWSEDAARQGWLDYDDQLYLVIKWKLRLWQNHVLICDEAQDVNKIRLAFLHLALRDGGRLYAVGDPKQCHPAGTQVWVSGEGYRPIETLRIGDEVMTYCYGYFPGKHNQGRKVRAVGTRWYEGDLIKLSAGDRHHEVTPNHRCHVRMTDRPGSLVYAMRLGNKVRVGRTAHNRGDFGLGIRARQEKADAAWILKIFREDQKIEAQMYELQMAYQFGLPQICFNAAWENQERTGMPSSVKQRFWEEFPDNINGLERCLEYHGLLIDHPFWSQKGKEHIGSKYSFVTVACNVFDGWMKICLFDDSPHEPRWETVDIERRKFAGDVWSLDVEPNNMGRSLYVADGIVTHNCIYGFTGAMIDSLDTIAREFGATEMPLTVSYRCARRIVERAQAWVPYIEASDTAPEGVVQDEVPLHAALATLTAEDAVLCRQTAPLVSVAYGLIARGRACRILGKEIGEGLVNLIEQQRARGLPRLAEKLEIWREREMAKFIARGEETRAEAVADRVNCILVIVDSLPETERTVPALVARIQQMFVDPRKGEKQTVLTLCTVHKAKGKEWSNVAILQPELMPSKAARQDWQIEQEDNLQYVAATRAKTRLIYCADGDTRVNPPEGR